MPAGWRFFYPARYFYRSTAASRRRSSTLSTPTDPYGKGDFTRRSNTLNRCFKPAKRPPRAFYVCSAIIVSPRHERISSPQATQRTGAIALGTDPLSRDNRCGDNPRLSGTHNYAEMRAPISPRLPTGIHTAHAHRWCPTLPRALPAPKPCSRD